MIQSFPEVRFFRYSFKSISRNFAENSSEIEFLLHSEILSENSSTNLSEVPAKIYTNVSPDVRSEILLKIHPGIPLGILEITSTFSMQFLCEIVSENTPEIQFLPPKFFQVFLQKFSQEIVFFQAYPDDSIIEISIRE